MVAVVVVVVVVGRLVRPMVPQAGGLVGTLARLALVLPVPQVVARAGPVPVPRVVARAGLAPVPVAATPGRRVRGPVAARLGLARGPVVAAKQGRRVLVRVPPRRAAARQAGLRPVVLGLVQVMVRCHLAGIHFPDCCRSWVPSLQRRRVLKIILRQ